MRGYAEIDGEEVVLYVVQCEGCLMHFAVVCTQERVSCPYCDSSMEPDYFDGDDDEGEYEDEEDS